MGTFWCEETAVDRERRYACFLTMFLLKALSLKIVACVAVLYRASGVPVLPPRAPAEQLKLTTQKQTLR